MPPRPTVLLTACVLVGSASAQAEQTLTANAADAALVTVIQAHSRCLLETNTLPAPKVRVIAEQWLKRQGVTQERRQRVERSPDFQDQVMAYIQQRGGCHRIIHTLLP